jgi:stage V sporulation protein AE
LFYYSYIFQVYRFFKNLNIKRIVDRLFINKFKKMEFLKSINWQTMMWAYIVGGLICVIGQIMIDKTKLTPARVLVIYVTSGVILGALGLYKPLVDIAGCGATVPLTGFGYNLAKGSLQAVKEQGLLGAFVGGVKSSAGGIAAAVFFGYIASLLAKPRIKSTK